MIFNSAPLITWTDKGLYCIDGGFYIDPHKSVDLAVITHAHSDHARRGSKKYICTRSGEGLLRTRLGKGINVESYSYGESFMLGGVKVSLHSAGHILGSAQVRIQREDEVWVASGDYKRDSDPSCDPFEVVKCDTFITEATFGTPKFVWEKNLNHGSLIHDWWNSCKDQSLNSILFGYSLGKAQRILSELEPYATKPILIHPSISELTECYRSEGRRIAKTVVLNQLNRRKRLVGELILAPPSVLSEEWSELFGEYKTAFASGWMQGAARGFGRSQYDHGFIMSDHADWNDLNQTIADTGAKRVFVQHRSGALIRHLRKTGIEAYPVDSLRKENYQNMGGRNLEFEFESN